MVTIIATTGRGIDHAKQPGRLPLDDIHKDPAQDHTGKDTKEDLDFGARIILLGGKPEADGIIENK